VSRREIEKYLRNEVSCSTRGDLVIKLYERAIRSLDVVLEREYPTVPALRKQELGRVVGILVELEAALDPSSSEELALLLLKLYRTLRRQVVESSSSSNPHGLVDVREQLRTLLQAWREVTAKTDRPRVRPLVDRRRKNRQR
jgi:flagellar protein FliS